MFLPHSLKNHNFSLKFTDNCVRYSVYQKWSGFFVVVSEWLLYIFPLQSVEATIVNIPIEGNYLTNDYIILDTFSDEMKLQHFHVCKF